MTKDEQARARLVEIALETTADSDLVLANATAVRTRAGFKNPRKGHWCAAGLTTAMEDAGLLVPAPGTPARRGAVALLDFVAQRGNGVLVAGGRPDGIIEEWRAIQPGDIIAWKQNKPPAEWYGVGDKRHAFATIASARSLCGKAARSPLSNDPADKTWQRCSSCVWETRKGHVALIVAVDDESITTVGWNEGNAPGRVMKRRLWRDDEHKCGVCKGRKTMPSSASMGGTSGMGAGLHHECRACKGTGKVPRSSTMLYRRPGGIYGIARPVAR